MAWLVGLVMMCLAVAAVVLGLRTWDLDGQVSDLTEENATLDRRVADLTAENDSLTAERDAIRTMFPITQAWLADANLEGTYEFLFVPVEGKCTYSDCDQIGSERSQLSISRSSNGYTLALEGAPGPPVPMSREGGVYSASGVLPQSMWGTCDDTPAETSFELHLSVAAVGLAGSDPQAVEARGTYRQYTPYAGLPCEHSESTSTFTARRTG
jgi:hypothetical protein